MTHRITSFVSHIWSNLPEISRDSVSAAAQAALKQLPWVIGTAVSFGFIHAAGTKSALMAMGVVALTGMFGMAYYIPPSLSLEEKVDKMLSMVKITGTALTFFSFGYTAHLYYTTALLLKSASTISMVSALLQNVYFGKFFLDEGFRWKNSIENERKDLREISTRVMDGLTDVVNKKGFHKLYVLACEEGLGKFIPISKMVGEDIRESFYLYLQENPDNFEKAVALFPVIFDPASICARWDNFEACKEVFSKLDERNPTDLKTLEYFEKKYRSPLKEEEIDQILTGEPDLKSLREFFNKFAQLKEMLHPISSIQFEGLIKELRRLHDKVQPSLGRLTKSYWPLVRAHVNQFDEPERTHIPAALEDLGLSLGGYIGNFHARGVYCLGDLKRENIVGGIEKEEIITRIKDYLKGRPLAPLQNKTLTAHSRVAKVAAACFNITLIGATLAAQFAFAPVLTGLGVAYGVIRGEKAINPLRFVATGLTFPTSCSVTATRLFRALLTLNTATWFGKTLAFMEGVNQGQTLRNYLMSFIWHIV